MVMDANGNIGENVYLTNVASKGNSDRLIAMNKEVRQQLTNSITIEHASG
jgi:hypothetical protein